MKRRLCMAAVACLTSSCVFAREDGFIEMACYLNTGRAARYQLAFKGRSCTVETDTRKQEVELSPAQSKAILCAFQAEVKRYTVAPRAFSSLEMEPGSVAGEHIGLEFEYRAPGTKLQIGLSIPFGEPSGLSKEMLDVIKEHFGLDLTVPKRPPIKRSRP